MNEEYKRTKEVNAQRDRESKKGRRKKIQAFRAYIIFIIIWRLKEKKEKNLGSEKTKPDSDNNSFSFFSNDLLTFSL